MWIENDESDNDDEIVMNEMMCDENEVMNGENV